MTTLRCPMVECRRRIDLEAIPVPPAQPVEAPCLHYIAAWDAPGGRLGEMAEAVLWGLRGNRELAIRNVRPAEVDPRRVDQVRGALEASARRFAHEVTEAGSGALFGDVHERNRVAFEFAQHILGPDPIAPSR
ncbi:MAG: hypothetical protein WC273_08550 [Dehalococcoidia bacterium]